MSECSPDTKDVTDQTSVGDVDGESAALLKCVCGARFEPWNQVVGIYLDQPWICPHCGAKLIMSVHVHVLQLV